MPATTTPGSLPFLRFEGPTRSDSCDLYEAIDDSGEDPRQHIYSCVAVCRTAWSAGWPAMGGTRWLRGAEESFEQERARARREAVELAVAMYMKHSLLRRADGRRGIPAAARAGDHGYAISDGGGLFGWQGGKGVIWSPPGEPLSPRRLLCHGLLLQRLGGEYVGSKDIGVGQPELARIEAAAELGWFDTRNRVSIGNGCGRDTGEATAVGIVTGLEAAVRQLALQGELTADADRPLAGLPLLLLGAGKVGLPLLAMLLEAGAEPWVFDPALAAPGASVDEHLQGLLDKGGAVGEAHRKVLQQLVAEGRVLHDEAQALGLPELRVVSPNGGLAGWLTRELGGRTRAEHLADAARRHGRLKLVLGAGNDQVPISESGRGERDRALVTLAEAGIWFVPDPVVSPGGVVAVSHELAPIWDPEAVLTDTRELVAISVDQFFARYRQLGGGPSPVPRADQLWATFQAMVDAPWL